MAQTWNPSQTNGGATLSGGNLTVTKTTAGTLFAPTYGSILVSTGKYYFEIAFTVVDGVILGIGNASASIANNSYVGFDANAIGWSAGGSGNVLSNATVLTAVTPVGAGTGRADVAIDLGAHLIWFRGTGGGATGNWNDIGAGDWPGMGIGGITIPSGVYTTPVTAGAAPQGSTGPDTATAHFTSASFVGTVPSGFGPFPADLGLIEDLFFRGVRRAWRARPQPLYDEFLRNPTQTVFVNWGFDEPRPHEGQPTRRKAWRAGAATLSDEFLLNPTQTVFARWGFDEPRQREPHPVVRPAWRARPLPLSDEFIRNPTQTVFVNWGFDEPRQREPQPVRRAPWHSRAQPDDTDIGAKQLVGVSWGFDEPPLSKLSRTRWHSREQPDDTDIGPKQLVGVSWGFDEPPFQRIVKTRWHSRSQPDDTDIGFTQLVGVPWGFEQEQREPHPILRRRWQAHSQPLSDEFLLNPTQTVFVSWGFDEPPFQRIVKTRWHSRGQPDDADIGARQLVAVSWGFDEPAFQHIVRTKWHSRAQPDDAGDIGRAQLVGVGWGFDEPPFQRIVRTPWHSRSQPDTADIGAIQLVEVPWGFDEPAFQRLVRTRWHSREQPDDTDIGATQLVGVPWGFDEPAFQHIVRTRWHSRVPPDDSDIGTQQQIVGIPWGFDEPQYQAIWRAKWHSRLQPDDADFGSIQLVGVPWGFEEDRQRVPRRPVNLNSIAQDEFLINVSQIITVVTWGFEEEQHRLERRRVHLNQTQPDEFLFNPTQIVFAPWGAFDEQSRVGRRSWRHRLLSDEPGFAQPTIPSIVWSDLDQWMRRPRISRRQLIEQLEFFQSVPPAPPTPTFVEWEDIRGVRRGRWRPNALAEFWDVFIPILPPALRQPTGHNFRASPGQPSPANFPPGVPPQLNEPGVTLYLSIGDGDLSPARLIFTKPSGATYTVGVPLIYLERPTPTPGGIFQGGTYAIYTFAGGELDELGVWRVQITRGSGKTSGPSIFTVVRNVSM